MPEWDFCDMPTENICQKWNICQEWDICDMPTGNICQQWDICDMPKMEYLPMFTVWSKQRCLLRENGDIITIKLNICQTWNIYQEWDICDMPKMEYSLGMVAFVQ